MNEGLYLVTFTHKILTMSSQNFIFDKKVISIEMGQSLAAGTDPKILYTKPDGTSGHWTGAVDGTKITFTSSQNEIDQPGHWQFSARVLISGSRVTSDVTVMWFDKPLDA